MFPIVNVFTFDKQEVPYWRRVISANSLGYLLRPSTFLYLVALLQLEDKSNCLEHSGIYRLTINGFGKYELFGIEKLPQQETLW